MRYLRSGCLYSINYSRYRDDPNPLILVLYSDTNKTHGLNLHYLDDKSLNKVVNMLANIASSRIIYKNSHILYHSYMKNHIPKVIKNSYRVYFTSKIKKPILISKGWEIKNFIEGNNVKIKNIKNVIHKEIKNENVKINSKNLSEQDIIELTEDLANKYKKIFGEKVDNNLFTGLRKNGTRRR